MLIGHRRRVLEQYFELSTFLGYEVVTGQLINAFVKAWNREDFETIDDLIGQFTEPDLMLLYEIYELQDFGIPELTELAVLYRDEFVDIIVPANLSFPI